MRATPPEIDLHRPSLYTTNPSWPPLLNRTPSSSSCPPPPWGFCPCPLLEKRRGGEEEGRGAGGREEARGPRFPRRRPGAAAGLLSVEEGGAGGGGRPDLADPEQELQPGTTSASLSRRRHCPYIPYAAPRRCAVLRPGGAHRHGTAVPRRTRGNTVDTASSSSPRVAAVHLAHEVFDQMPIPCVELLVKSPMEP
jgi:hypothetical protein